MFLSSCTRLHAIVIILKNCEYFLQVYERQVKDDQQPLLISQPKEKDRKRGMSGPILLLPEFCVITGLSDEIRANFSVMKDLAQHTRISPAARASNLTSFMQDLNKNKEVSSCLFCSRYCRSGGLQHLTILQGEMPVVQYQG